MFGFNAFSQAAFSATSEVIIDEPIRFVSDFFNRAPVKKKKQKKLIVSGYDEELSILLLMGI